MAKLDPRALSQAVRSRRFLALDRAGVDLGAIATWDDALLRDLRLLVPVDLQALVVREGDEEPMVRLPLLLAGADPRPEDGGLPEPFAEGEPRPPGVHLHWAMPDALLRGRLEPRPDGAENRLGLRPLPDRWVVLRLLAPLGEAQPLVRGWVLEADRAIAMPLERWTEGGSAGDSVPAGQPVDASALTGTAGGDVTWSGVYDAVLNRFAFHDPLDDVEGEIDDDAAAYLVAGWWSDPRRDPLDAARSAASFAELLDELRWRPQPDVTGGRAGQLLRASDQALRTALGLRTAARHAPAAAPPARTAAMDTAFVALETSAASSAFAAGARRRYTTPPWDLRSTLLHGALYGVPVRGEATPERRPPREAVRVALGRHDDDVLAALAALPAAGADAREDAERLLSAFTTQRLDRVGTPDGAVEVEDLRHAAGFVSRPAGTDGTDRFLAGGRGASGPTRGAGARDVAVRKGVRIPKEGAATRAAKLVFAERPKDLVAASGPRELMAALHDTATDAVPPAEPREVVRPAPRWTSPVDPLVAVQGAGRSLRHGGDGRSSPDGRLGCRWPSQVIQDMQGVVDGARLLPSLGSGAVPPEVLLLAREALVTDPYHADWLAASAGARVDPGLGRPRLRAEALLRFGTDATYDGGTDAFAAAGGDVQHASPQHRRWVADIARRFSLLRGADPDPVGVTAWSQPWVPLWLEWEAELRGPAAPSLGGWALGVTDLEREDDPDGPARVLRGRSLLTTGAARTLGDAVDDWLQAERLRTAAGAREADRALAGLAEGVRHLDVVTAVLDGARLQLLGLPATTGLRRPLGTTGVPARPAPVSAPALLVSGALRLTRARLLDAFGRTLELPLEEVRVPAHAAAAAAGALRVPPRLMRPARWRFRLVDAAAAIDDTGAADARVDQVDPALAVSPVAGFLLPDHLDESLEVFGADGAPLGELLHEAVGGTVVWEIAAGRDGPADAPPGHGLAPAQAVLGRLATGLLAADARARTGDEPPPESALSALLRAIDTTLWTVDTFAALGSEHVAGLVGRPIAVVRVQLRLELEPEDGLDLSDPRRAAERLDAERKLASVALPVRIGELTRTDDGVLGFFVGDDLQRLHLVDRVVAAFAPEAGRHRGQLGLLGRAPAMPPAAPISHPYVFGAADADTVLLHVGQTVTLTLLMHPAGRAHLTSGVLPREAVALARDWVAPGLAAIAPSLRTGPLLVETDLAEKGEVRLPKVSVLGRSQALLWRDTPGSWRTDAILAATQDALLPDQPAEVREGWVRVVPEEPRA